MMKYHPTALLGAAAALLASCSSTPLPPDTAPRAVVGEPQVAAAAQAAQPQTVQVQRTSAAPNPRAYRTDAAQHIYALNEARIWKGRLPPMLYAIGVLQVEVDGRGNVRHMNWMRAPKHAPEVIAEIEKTVRAAAPFPVPARMGKVVYTDTWLWHKSGHFQLDTLTEGQD
jgi:protein TonB